MKYDVEFRDSGFNKRVINLILCAITLYIERVVLSDVRFVLR